MTVPRSDAERALLTPRTRRALIAICAAAATLALSACAGPTYVRAETTEYTIRNEASVGLLFTLYEPTRPQDEPLEFYLAPGQSIRHQVIAHWSPFRDAWFGRLHATPRGSTVVYWIDDLVLLTFRDGGCEIVVRDPPGPDNPARCLSGPVPANVSAYLSWLERERTVLIVSTLAVLAAVFPLAWWVRGQLWRITAGSDSLHVAALYAFVLSLFPMVLVLLSLSNAPTALRAYVIGSSLLGSVGLLALSFESWKRLASAAVITIGALQILYASFAAMSVALVSATLFGVTIPRESRLILLWIIMSVPGWIVVWGGLRGAEDFGQPPPWGNQRDPANR